MGEVVGFDNGEYKSESAIPFLHEQLDMGTVSGIAILVMHREERDGKVVERVRPCFFGSMDAADLAYMSVLLGQIAMD